MKNYKEEALETKESYDVFHALKSAWSYDDELLAFISIYIGDFQDCTQFLELYEGEEAEDEDKQMEHCLMVFYAGPHLHCLQDFMNEEYLDSAYIEEYMYDY